MGFQHVNGHLASGLATRAYSTIVYAEWICWYWIDVTAMSDAEAMYIRGRQRPLDEAIKMAGGSISDLEPYLWALKVGPEGANKA